MKRYFIELSYNGSPFNGWQRQINAPSVQKTIEQALSTLLQNPILITGCGRTDTGVHATFYVAHFETDKPFDLNEHFIYQLNAVLPNSIAISNLYPTDLHARFDAKVREYKYFIQPSKNPFNRNTTWQITTPLDLKAMQTAADMLLTKTDFSSFAKLHSDNKTNICYVSHAEWQEIDSQFVFTIRADRFLRGMVRGIVGTLVEVGRKKITPTQFQEILLSLNRANASAQAPPQGLFLTNIIY